MPVSASEVSALLAAQNQQFMQAMGYAQGVTQTGMGGAPNPLSMNKMSGDSRQAQAFGATDTAAGALSGAASAGGMAMVMGAAFGMAPRVLDPFTSAVHQGVIGFRTHGVAGALGRGAVLGLGPSLAVGYAASKVTDAIIGGMQQHAQLGVVAQSTLGSLGTNLPGMNLGAGGIFRPTLGLSQQVAGAMGGVMNQFADTPTPMGMQELTSHLQFGAQMGTFRGTGSVGEFRNKLSGLANRTRAVARQLQSSLSEAQAAMAEVSSMGMSQDVAATLLPGLQGTSAVTGLGTGQVLAMGQQGSTLFRQMGLNGAQGGAFSIGLANRIGAAAQSGIISREHMARMGGVEGALSRYTGAATNFFGSRGGQQMLGAMMTSTGELDVGMAERIASGGVTWAEIRKEFRERAGGMSGRGMLMANQQELTGQFMSQFGMQGLLPAINLATSQSRTGRRFGADFALQQFTGMNRQDMLGLQSMEAAGPMIQQQLRMAAQQGLNEGRMTGAGDISTRLSQFVSELTQPVRATFRSIGQRMSAGLTEAVGSFQADLGLAPAPGAIDPVAAGMRVTGMHHNAVGRMLMGGAMVQAGASPDGRFGDMATGGGVHTGLDLAIAMGATGGGGRSSMFNPGPGYTPSSWVGAAGAHLGLANYQGYPTGLGLAGIMGGRAAGGIVRAGGTGLNMLSRSMAARGAAFSRIQSVYRAGQALHAGGSMFAGGLGMAGARASFSGGWSAFKAAGDAARGGAALSAGGFGGRAFMPAVTHGMRGMGLMAAGAGMGLASGAVSLLGTPLLALQFASGGLTEGLAEMAGDIEIDETMGALPRSFANLESAMVSAGMIDPDSAMTERLSGSDMRVRIPLTGFRPIAGTGRSAWGARSTGRGLHGHLQGAMGYYFGPGEGLGSSGFTQRGISRPGAASLAEKLSGGHAGMEAMLRGNVGSQMLAELAGETVGDPAFGQLDPGQYAVTRTKRMANLMAQKLPQDQLNRMVAGTTAPAGQTWTMAQRLLKSGAAAAALGQGDPSIRRLTSNMAAAARWGGGANAASRDWLELKATDATFEKALMEGSTTIETMTTVGAQRINPETGAIERAASLQGYSQNLMSGKQTPLWTWEVVDKVTRGESEDPDEYVRRVAEEKGVQVDGKGNIVAKLNKETGQFEVEVGGNKTALTDMSKAQGFVSKQFKETVQRLLTPEQAYEVYRLAQSDPKAAEYRMRQTTAWKTAMNQVDATMKLRGELNVSGQIDIETMGAHKLTEEAKKNVRTWAAQFGGAADSIADELINNTGGNQTDLLEQITGRDFRHWDGDSTAQTDPAKIRKGVDQLNFNNMGMQGMLAMVAGVAAKDQAAARVGRKTKALDMMQGLETTGGTAGTGKYLKEHTGITSGAFASAVDSWLGAVDAFTSGEGGDEVHRLWAAGTTNLIKEAEKLPPHLQQKAIRAFRSAAAKGNTVAAEVADLLHSHMQATPGLAATISGSGGAKRGLARQQQFAAVFGGLETAHNIMTRRGRKLAKGGAIILSQEDKAQMQDELAERIMSGAGANIPGFESLASSPQAARQKAGQMVTDAMNLYESEGLDEKEIADKGRLLNQIKQLSVTTSGTRKSAGDLETYASQLSNLLGGDSGLIQGLKRLKDQLPTS